jgi:hypothetical protein
MKPGKLLRFAVWFLFACGSNVAGLLSAAFPRSGPAFSKPIVFSETGWTEHGEWRAWGSVRPAIWEPGLRLDLDLTLEVTDDHLAQLASDHNLKAEAFLLLVTAERTFDADGRLRQVNDEKMSTLVTPTGLAIEGGIQGACTNRFGYDWKTPVDELRTVLLPAAKKTAAAFQARFDVSTPLPANLPPGIYRLRFDVGLKSGSRSSSLNGDGFATRPFPKGRAPESHFYSRPLPANGPHVSGRFVDAAAIKPRVPWILLGEYNSNGYRGAVAAEDKPHFALSSRNLIPDDIILPLYDDAGRTLAYNLEPQFPADTIEARSNIPWNAASGELQIVLTLPDGKNVDLGRHPFSGKRNAWPTTGQPALTAWKPPMYGKYTARVAGWIQDIWGNRYEGGGTYEFWIAKRMTLATATFQGVPYPVGGRYGRDLGLAPAVPADVEVEAVLYVASDPANAVRVAYTGKASPGGIFGSAQGAMPLLLNTPGEYCAHILATYRDPDGHLWVSTMRHAGMVYPSDSTLIARGKKIQIGGKFHERGETHNEGSVDADGTPHLVHITFPFQSGDVLLIASEQQGANKIEPVLTYEDKAKPVVYDPSKFNGVGASNLKIKTSNGYSPHLFPEYITEWQYFYAAAPRPGFMSRFIVGENGIRAPYWPTSPNSFGGQISASANGDLPGDIYRLIGGVVVRKTGEPARYAGYVSSGFLLPKGTENNRIIGPGAEEIQGPTGEKARFFLVGLRPGMVYETGASFGAAAQIDPILPVNVRYAVQYPDGRTVEAQGAGDSFGTFAGSVRWTLDQPGIYKYWIEADWNGFRGSMPGLPTSGGDFYVIEKDRPAGATGLKLNLPNQSSFNAAQTLLISGSTTSAAVDYAVVIPGCVIEQGRLAPKNGRFEYRFDPVAVHNRAPTYDIVNMVNGKPEIGKAVHITFFSRETTPQGQAYHSFARVILRGTKVFYTR